MHATANGLAQTIPDAMHELQLRSLISRKKLCDIDQIVLSESTQYWSVSIGLPFISFSLPIMMTSDNVAETMCLTHNLLVYTTTITDTKIAPFEIDEGSMR